MGFWAATAKSNTSNMKINRSPPPLSPGQEKRFCQPLIWEQPLMNTQPLQRAVAGARGGEKSLVQVMERRQTFVSPQSSCVCAVCWGSERLWSQLLKVGGKVIEGDFDIQFFIKSLYHTIIWHYETYSTSVKLKELVWYFWENCLFSFLPIEKIDSTLPLCLSVSTRVMGARVRSRLA